jgi:hypothetical protein
MGTGPQRPDGHVPLYQVEGRRGQQRRTRLRELLHARGEVRRLPDSGVVHAEVRADGSHDHFTGIQPYPDLDADPRATSSLVRIAPDGFLHPQGGVARPHRVILVSQRRAKQRHDPVAHHLVDGALVAVDGFHHVLEHGVEEPARLLWIAVGQQLHRALQVGEEHRHLLALALERGFGR